MTDKEFRKTFKIAETAEQTTAIVEKKHWNAYGKKLSSPFQMIFNTREEWMNWQIHGPRQGWYVNEIKEAPKDLDLTYNDPDPENPQPVIMYQRGIKMKPDPAV